MAIEIEVILAQRRGLLVVIYRQVEPEIVGWAVCAFCHGSREVFQVVLRRLTAFELLFKPFCSVNHLLEIQVIVLQLVVPDPINPGYVWIVDSIHLAGPDEDICDIVDVDAEII